MCPECIPTAAMTAAGGSSIASLSLFFLRNLVATIRKKHSIPDQSGGIRHD
jgi:hypothetical protein